MKYNTSITINQVLNSVSYKINIHGLEITTQIIIRKKINKYLTNLTKLCTKTSVKFKVILYVLDRNLFWLVFLYSIILFHTTKKLYFEAKVVRNYQMCSENVILQELYEQIADGKIIT